MQSSRFSGTGLLKRRILIWTVLILDSLPCLFRLFIGTGDAMSGHAHHLLTNYPAKFFELYGFMAGIAVCGLCGNSLVLFRRKAGIPFVIASIVLVLIFDGLAVWEHRHESDSRAYYAMLAMIGVRMAWLVFYGVVVRIAIRDISRAPRKR